MVTDKPSCNIHYTREIAVKTGLNAIDNAVDRGTLHARALKGTLHAQRSGGAALLTFLAEEEVLGVDGTQSRQQI